jgi:hypothetical protein
MHHLQDIINLGSVTYTKTKVERPGLIIRVTPKDVKSIVDEFTAVTGTWN